MSEPIRSDLQPSDIATLPTIMVVMDEHGDVNFASNNPDIDLVLAMSMIDLAKQKMMATYFNVVKQQRDRANAMRPQILIPTR